jgi:hypothetical protein
VLAVLLVLAVVGFAVIPRVTGGSSKDIKTVRVLAGSETAPYLNDPNVAKRLAEDGYKLVVDTAGSGEIVTRDLAKYDVAFPSNATYAQQIRVKIHSTRSVYVPFSTPMAIATFADLAGPLTAAKITQTTVDGTTFFDMAAYLKLVAQKTRWSDLPDNPTYPAKKSIYISSTDVRTSNSAALYLALASYVANGNDVVSDTDTAKKVAGQLWPLFQLQGFLDSTTQEPFDDYLHIGEGKTPLVMIYESQYRAHLIANDQAIRPTMRLMYPNPTIYAKHTVVPLDDAGDAVGRLLTTDATLQRLAAAYGFRTADTGSTSNQAGVGAPPRLINVVDPPTLEVSEAMIGRIDELFRSGGGG